VTTPARRQRARIALLLAFGATSVYAQAAHAQVVCPPSVAVEQKAATPNEWSVEYSKQPAELAAVTIFDGPPEQMASLKYDDERTTKSEIIQTWKLPPSDRGYWMVCGYSNTTTLLRRKLPNDVRACEVVFEKGVSFGGGGMVVKRARCTAVASTKSSP
jgi:hypothetical protein